MGSEEVRLPLINDAKSYEPMGDDDEAGMTLGSPDRKIHMIDDRINSLLF